MCVHYVQQKRFIFLVNKHNGSMSKCHNTKDNNHDSLETSSIYLTLMGLALYIYQATFGYNL